MSDLYFVIDAANYIHKYWAAAQGNSNVSASQRLVELTENFCRKHSPAGTFVVFDEGGETFRHRLYADYKKGRSEKDDRLKAEIGMAKMYFRDKIVSGYEVVSQEGVEADDLIGRIVFFLEGRVLILSNDSDLNQLLEKGRVSIIKKASCRKGVWNYDYYTEDNLIQDKGIAPCNWSAFKALAGDSSDNWGGCEGIGDKTAKDLIDELGKEDSHSTLMAIAGKVEAGEKPASLKREKQWEALQSFDFNLAFRITSLSID